MTKIPLPGTATPTLTDAAVRPTATAQSVTAALINPPQAVARLPAGAIIAGVVLNRDATGATHLRTANGTLVVQSRSPIEPGTSVNLRIQTEAGGGRSLLVSITPQAPNAATAPPPTAAAAPAAATQQGASPASPAQAAVVTAPLAGEPSAPTPRPAAIIEDHPAILARAVKSGTTGSPPQTAGSGPPPPPPAQVPAALRPLLGNGPVPTFRPGSEVIIRIASVDATPQAVAAQTTSATPAPQLPAGLVAVRPISGSAYPPAPIVPAPDASGQTAGRPSPVGSPSPAAPATPQIGSPPVPQTGSPPLATGPAHVRSTPGAAASAGLAAGASTASGNGLLPAVVVGQNAAGEPLLQTAFGPLNLALKANLPAGARAVLEVVAARTAAAAQAGSPPTQSSGLDLSREWPALKHALETVEKTHPPAAAQLQQLVAARPGPDLANSLLFLMAALRLGSAKAWLGPDASALLGRGEGDIAARLVDEFGALSRLATEANPGDWKAYFLPFHDGEALRQMRIFTRRQKKPNGDGDEDAATRFVVEVDLSRLGPMQLDGLSHDGRFDLIVRSRAALPADIRKTIAGIFDGFRRGGLSGEIGFQADPVFPVAPLEEIGDGHVGVLA